MSHVDEDDYVMSTDLVEQIEERGTGDITEGEKYEFLQMIRQGYDRREAAMALGYTARPWRALTSPKSRFYDESFTNSYAEAVGSPESKMHYVERLREEVRRRALTDSDRLLEKEAMVHLPEWAVLRQKDVNVNARVIFEQHLKDLPTDLLKRIYAELEEEGAIEIDDADVIELPPAVDGESNGGSPGPA